MKSLFLAPVLSLALTWAATDGPYFPIKTKAGGEGVTAFEAQWYAKSLRRMKEPPLPDLTKDVNAELYRLMILPTWGNPIVVRIHKRGELYSLSARRLDGQGGYDPGKLVEAKDFELNSDDSKALEQLIGNLNFFELPTDDEVFGHDGDQWVLEGVAHGKYHVATRWCPSSYNPDKRGLKSFLELCTFLMDKSGLSQGPKNKGRKLL